MKYTFKPVVLIIQIILSSGFSVFVKKCVMDWSKSWCETVLGCNLFYKKPDQVFAQNTGGLDVYLILFLN